MSKKIKNNIKLSYLNKINQLSLENFKGFEKKINLNFSPGINLRSAESLERMQIREYGRKINEETRSKNQK